jgi:hypothetical protein
MKKPIDPRSLRAAPTIDDMNPGDVLVVSEAPSEAPHTKRGEAGPPASVRGLVEQADQPAVAQALRDLLGLEGRCPPMTVIDVDDDGAVITLCISIGHGLRCMEQWTTDGNEYIAGPAQLWSGLHATPPPVLTGRELALRLAARAADEVRS